MPAANKKCSYRKPKQITNTEMMQKQKHTNPPKTNAKEKKNTAYPVNTAVVLLLHCCGSCICIPVII